MEPLRQALLDNTFVLATAKHRFNMVRDILEHALYQADAPASTTDDAEADTRAASAADRPDLKARYTTAVQAIEVESDRRALEAWGTDWLDNVRSGTFNAQVESMQSWLQSLPVLPLYIPTALDDAAYAIIGQWCRAELNDRLMLEIDVDPELVGGCAFIKDDLYHEYSLRSQLDADPTLISDIFDEYANV